MADALGRMGAPLDSCGAAASGAGIGRMDSWSPATIDGCAGYVRTLPDGRRCEVARTAQGAPPGWRGQATNCTAAWVRYDGGAWAAGERTVTRTLRACDNGGASDGDV